MNGPDAAEEVIRQYASPDKLKTRISIHDKYSLNPQKFADWIAERYDFPAGAGVLEVGCGTGSFWLDREDLIHSCSRLVLSDFSEGMLQTARETLREVQAIEYRIIDIQDIPFEDCSFDAVIANMMLYHVPDIHRGLDEAARVLRPGGTFYCATYGENGITEYLCGLFGIEDPGRINHSFTLQNGAGKLLRHFSDVQRCDYPDSLAVTDVNDLADYIRSLAGMTALRSIPREEMTAVMRSHTKNGVLSVPKEYGMFISRK